MTGIGTVSCRDQAVADEAVPADALHRRAGKELAEGRIIQPQERGQRRRLQILPRLQLGFAGLHGKLVPGAGGKAVIAAIDAVAQGLAKLCRDGPCMFDGQIGDATPGIEPVGLREGICRTGGQAGPAGTAMVPLRLCGSQIQRGEDAGEKEPGSEPPRHQIGVLALPAKAGSLGQRLFHHRRRIDEDLHITAACARDEKARQLLQLALDDIVIIPVAGVDGNIAPVRVGKVLQRIPGRAIVHGQHDDGAHLRPQHAGAGTPVCRFFHPAHGAVMAIGEKLCQPLRGLRDGIGPGDGEIIKAQLGGLVPELAAKAVQSLCRKHRV